VHDLRRVGPHAVPLVHLVRPPPTTRIQKHSVTQTVIDNNYVYYDNRVRSRFIDAWRDIIARIAKIQYYCVLINSDSESGAGKQLRRIFHPRRALAKCCLRTVFL
jgi:hypothetical protein